MLIFSFILFFSFSIYSIIVSHKVIDVNVPICPPLSFPSNIRYSIPFLRASLKIVKADVCKIIFIPSFCILEASCIDPAAIKQKGVLFSLIREI